MNPLLDKLPPPHYCAMDHEPIWYNDSENEMCPLCRALAQAQGEQRGEWISVKDRLPATPKGGGWSDAVLVCYPLKDPENWKVDYPNGWVVTDRRIFVGADGKHNWDLQLPVTHWMPLPPPPSTTGS